jgi:hypothetical protein
MHTQWNNNLQSSLILREMTDLTADTKIRSRSDSNLAPHAFYSPELTLEALIKSKEL